MALQRNTEVVRPDRHAEFAGEVRENLAGCGAFAMRPDSPQSGIAQRYGLFRLRSPDSAACGGRRRRRRGSRGSSSSASLRGFGLSEPCQHTLGDFQFIELGTQLFPFGVEPREPLGDLLLLLSNLVQRSHLLSPSSPIPSVVTLHRYSAINGGPPHRKKMALEKLLPFYGCAANPRSAARRSVLEFGGTHDPQFA